MKKVLLSFVLVLFVAVTALAGPVGYTQGSYFMAVTKHDLDRVTDLVLIKDIEMLKVMVEAGLVMTLPAGIKVEVLESTWGKVQIRAFGTTFVVWTYIEAVKMQ